MKKTNWFLLSGVIMIFLAAAVALFQHRDAIGSVKFKDFKELDWRDLAELDYVSGAVPPSIKDLDGRNVRIPGFMVPLEDNSKAITEFLLVPSPQACIHVPPPPPNQMVHVQMQEGQQTSAAYGPIWVYGRLSLQAKKHMYGESSFSMQGYHIEDYK